MKIAVHYAYRGRMKPEDEKYYIEQIEAYIKHFKSPPHIGYDIKCGYSTEAMQIRWIAFNAEEILFSLADEEEIYEMKVADWPGKKYISKFFSSHSIS